MKKMKVLFAVTTILVLIIGSVPGFEIGLSNLSILSQDSDGQYWKALLTAIPSILIGILIGYFLCRYLLKKWLKTGKSIWTISLLVLLITFIAGIITVMVAWEVTWVLSRLLRWKYTEEFSPWANLLDHYLLMLMYGCILVGITSIVNGLFAFLYLKFSK